MKIYIKTERRDEVKFNAIIAEILIELGLTDLPESDNLYSHKRRDILTEAKKRYSRVL